MTVGGYKGIEVDKVEDQEEVTDEDIDNYIASVQQQNAQEVTDRPVQEGDIANIDFVGKMDGQEFDGGSAGTVPAHKVLRDPQEVEPSTFRIPQNDFPVKSYKTLSWSRPA